MLAWISVFKYKTAKWSCSSVGPSGSSSCSKQLNRFFDPEYLILG